MVYNKTMLLVNIHDAKAHLSEYLNRLDVEQEIVLCKRNVPIAVIRPVAEPAGRRVIGLEKGRLHVPDSFNDPLPEEIEALYDGERE
jgi:prevent-host-death family protein